MISTIAFIFYSFTDFKFRSNNERAGFERSVFVLFSYSKKLTLEDYFKIYYFISYCIYLSKTVTKFCVLPLWTKRYTSAVLCWQLHARGCWNQSATLAPLCNCDSWEDSSSGVGLISNSANSAENSSERLRFLLGVVLAGATEAPPLHLRVTRSLRFIYVLYVATRLNSRIFYYLLLREQLFIKLHGNRQ